MQLCENFRKYSNTPEIPRSYDVTIRLLQISEAGLNLGTRDYYLNKTVKDDKVLLTMFSDFRQYNSAAD